MRATRSPLRGRWRPAATPPIRAHRATRPTGIDPAAFIASLDEATRGDCQIVDGWMSRVAGPGTMYGTSIVGYGSRSIRYADGRELPWMKMGFSPRKHALVLYGLLGGGAGALLPTLGKHATGKGCLYVKRLSDVDGKVLRRLIAAAAKG